jgi:hypothetical protein
VKSKETGSIRVVLQLSYVRPLRYAEIDSDPARRTEHRADERHDD